jgi:hypothetical protein
MTIAPKPNNSAENTEASDLVRPFLAHAYFQAALLYLAAGLLLINKSLQWKTRQLKDLTSSGFILITRSLSLVNLGSPYMMLATAPVIM